MRLNKILLGVLLVCSINACKEENSDKTVSKSNGVSEVAGLPYFNTPLFTPEWKTGTHQIPEFSFINQKGDTVTNKTVEGSIYVADFFFTICPGICPSLTTNMGLLQEEYKNDSEMLLLSHTVMPWNDTPDKLLVYANKNNIQLPQWHLLTGDTDAMYDIARNGYFADEDFTKTQDEARFIHTENFILVDKKGYIRGVYNGTLALEVKRLMRHIDILKKEL